MKTIIAILFTITLISCSESEKTSPSIEYKFTAYAVDASFKIDKTQDLQGSIEWGVVNGEYFGTPDSAAKFMIHKFELHAGQPVTASRLNGQTLFVRVTSDNSFQLLLSKDGKKETNEHSVSKATLMYK